MSCKTRLPRQFLPFHFFAIALVIFSALISEVRADAAFTSKLKELLKRLDRSTALTREQILRSPGAPFLSELYMQLAMDLIQKAEALYYLNREQTSVSAAHTPNAGAEAQSSGPVARATEDAIGVLSRIDSDYPTYAKRPKVLLLLASSYKSIGQMAQFRATIEKLEKEFPASAEAAKGRLALAEEYFRLQSFEDVLVTLKPVMSSTWPRERNTARHLAGLVYLQTEKFKESLTQFEAIATDPELSTENEGKEREKNESLEIIKGNKKENLRREALIDSVRAYTQVYAKSGDPISYYLALSPNETYFQETLEKLAERYVSLKEYAKTIQILRAISERTREPIKVVRIYVDVLSKLSVEERKKVDPSELDFLLKNLELWLTHFQVGQSNRKELLDFFEKQVREFGTTAHEGVSRLPVEEKKKRLLRVEELYLLHLKYFPDSTYRTQIAINLANVYRSLGEDLKCGELNLNLTRGDYGSIPDPLSKLENSIACLQHFTSQNFFAQVRGRGLLIKSLRTYIARKPKAAMDSKISFALLKAEYDQGYYEETLPKFLTFITKHPSSETAVSAGEMILDHYHVRNDLAGLKKAASEMLRMKLPNPAFNQKVQTLSRQLSVRQLNEKVEAISQGSKISSSEAYLQVIQSVGDSSLQNLALQRALADSRKEGKIDLFFRAAQMIARQEPSAEKRGELAMAQVTEATRIGRFIFAYQLLSQLRADSALPQKIRAEAYRKSVALATQMRDPERIRSLFTDRAAWMALDKDAKAAAEQLIASYLLAPVKFSGAFLSFASGLSQNEEIAKGLLKRHALSETLKKERCLSPGSDKSVFCSWVRLELQEQGFENWIAQISRADSTVEGIERFAKTMEGLVQGYDQGPSGDAHLDLIRVLRVRGLLEGFAGYLNKVAEKNAEVAGVLRQKAAETQATAEKNGKACQEILLRAQLPVPGASYCRTKENARYAALIGWKSLQEFRSPSADFSSPASKAKESVLFQNPESSEAYLEQLETFLNAGSFHQAMAGALIGMVRFKTQSGEMNTVAGCASYRLGLYPEARYFLNTGTEWKGWLGKCKKGFNLEQS